MTWQEVIEWLDENQNVATVSGHDYSLKCSLNGLLPDDVCAILSQYTGKLLTLKHCGTCSETGARWLALFGGWLFISGLTDLTPKVAEVLSKHKNYLHIDCPESCWDIEVLSALAHREPALSLGYTGELYPADAELFGRQRGALSLFYDARVGGYGNNANLDLQAIELAKHQGKLELGGWEISPFACEQLAKHQGGLDIEANLSYREIISLAKSTGGLRLPNSDIRDGHTAQCLAAHDGDLNLDGISVLLFVVAEGLASHKGHLTLRGLKSISSASAKQLGQAQGSLSLSGLETITPDCLEPLLSRDILSLEGLTSISPEVALMIADRPGISLYLPYDLKPSDDVAVILRKAKSRIFWYETYREEAID